MNTKNSAIPSLNAKQAEKPNLRHSLARYISGKALRNTLKTISIPLLMAAGAATATPFNNNSESVLLQGFYWDIYDDLPSGLSYWDMMNYKAGEISANGFDMVWTPPPTHSSGWMGYHPRELNNLNGAFGSKNQLSNMIQALQNRGVKVISDVVINHRQGKTECDAEFTNPYFPTEWIVANDEWNPGHSGCTGYGSVTNWEHSDNNRKGNNYDWGIPWDGARDLDHENPSLRDAIRHWMKNVLGKGANGVGFDGWRYDLAHGYNGKWAGEYNEHTNAYFAVGETWFAVNDTSNPQSVRDGRQNIINWLDEAQGKSFAFDFTTKYLLNDVLGGFSKKDGQYYTNPPSYEFGRLKGSDGKPAGVIGAWPGRAVTFVENHDSGPGTVCNGNNSNGQAHLALSCGHVGQAYAYILTHPGVPTVYWPHIENHGSSLRNEILDLMRYRKEMGVHSGNGYNDNPVTIHRAERNIYAATIQGHHGEIAIQMGKSSSECGSACFWQPPGSGWQFRRAGLDYWIWTRSN